MQFNGMIQLTCLQCMVGSHAVEWYDSVGIVPVVIGALMCEGYLMLLTGMIQLAST